MKDLRYQTVKGSMSNNNGDFSANLSSLQLQLISLFEGCGGSRAVVFLDAVSKLGKLEREILLDKFTGMVNKFLSGNERLLTEEDVAQDKFVDELYNQIVNSIKKASSENSDETDANGVKLEVLDGGKSKAKALRATLDLTKARLAKKAGFTGKGLGQGTDDGVSPKPH